MNKKYLAEISFEGRDFGSRLFDTYEDASNYLTSVQSDNPQSACGFNIVEIQEVSRVPRFALASEREDALFGHPTYPIVVSDHWGVTIYKNKRDA